MPHDLETRATHEPDLSRQHGDGPRQDRRSPAERALAPEADMPPSSANGVTDDGRYVGRAGGYAGAASPTAASGPARAGEGTYGYPAGAGVGMPGGEHQPEGLPDPDDRTLEDRLPPEPTLEFAQRKKGPTRRAGP